MANNPLLFRDGQSVFDYRWNLSVSNQRRTRDRMNHIPAFLRSKIPSLIRLESELSVSKWRFFCSVYYVNNDYDLEIESIASHSY